MTKSYDIKISNISIPTVKLAMIIILFVCHVVFYNLFGTYNTMDNYSYFMELDHTLPFVPEMVWVYMSTYIVMLLIGFTIKDNKELFRLIVAILYTWILTYPFFYFFPAIYPRPSFKVIDLTTQLLKYNYLYDVSNNTFPSLHVSLSFIVALTMVHIKSKIKLLWLFWAILVSMSTVLVKKHFVLDVFGGYAVAQIAYLLSFKLKTADLIIEFFYKFLKRVELIIDKIFDKEIVKEQCNKMKTIRK
jgi:membrane-associated phospholipid phosphatase